jgi:hypothetical protein
MSYQPQAVLVFLSVAMTIITAHPSFPHGCHCAANFFSTVLFINPEHDILA